VWPVSRWCLLLRDTWSYLRICRRFVLLYTRFCNCLLDYACVLHIVNFAILYLVQAGRVKPKTFKQSSLVVIAPCQQHDIQKLWSWVFRIWPWKWRSCVAVCVARKRTHCYKSYVLSRGLDLQSCHWQWRQPPNSWLIVHAAQNKNKQTYKQTNTCIFETDFNSFLLKNNYDLDFGVWHTSWKL
jgi:hypothetical protein